MELTYEFSDEKGKTLYDQLYTFIRDDILSGKIPARSKLPSKRELSESLHISITSVMNAYSQLVMEGYVESVAKSGFYVADIQKGSLINTKRPVYPKLYEEEKWFADFRANNTLYHNFPFSTWKKVIRDTLSEYDSELIQRGNVFGARILREEIADYLYRSRGIATSPECIVIGYATPYLYELITKMLPSHFYYAVENPGYLMIPRVLNSLNVRWGLVDMDENGINMKSLEEKNVNLLHVSPEHHYPLGIITSTVRRQELLNWANESPSRFILEDDYDCEFRYHSRPISALKSMDTNGKVIYMNTFSKTMSPSIRICYMVLPERLVQKFISTTSFYNNTTSTLEQYALTRFIHEGYFERHINRMKKFYKKEDELLRSILLENKNIPIKDISPFSSGTHLLVNLDTDLDDRHIKSRAARQGINVGFLSDFCIKDHEQFSHTMVINYSNLSNDILHNAVERIGNCFSPIV